MLWHASGGQRTTWGVGSHSPLCGVEHRLSGLAAVSLPTELACWPIKLINTPDIFWANFPVSLWLECMTDIKWIPFVYMYMHAYTCVFVCMYV